MFGLGIGEIVIILVLALILLGPQRLPDAAKQLGKSLREFKKATDDLKSQFEGELYADPRPAPRRGETTALPAAPEAPPALIPPGAVPAGGPAPAATVDNVPGLEAALAEPTPPLPAQAQVKPEPPPERPADGKAP